ncbi:MAG: HD-GYP domain-containing protein [bacterium]
MVRLADMLQPGKGPEGSRSGEKGRQGALPEVLILSVREEVIQAVRDALEERGYRFHHADSADEARSRRKVAGRMVLVADESLEGAADLVRDEIREGRPALLVVAASDSPRAEGLPESRVVTIAEAAEDLLKRIQEIGPDGELPGGEGRRRVFTSSEGQGPARREEAEAAGEEEEATAVPEGDPGEESAEAEEQPAGPTGPAPVPGTGRAPASPEEAPPPAPNIPSASSDEVPDLPGPLSGETPVSASVPRVRAQGPPAAMQPAESEVYRETVEAVRRFTRGHRSGSNPPLTDVAHQVEELVRALGESNDVLLHVIFHVPEFEDVDDYLAHHQVNTSVYALKIADGLKYSDRQRYETALAAAIHDVGMTRLPEGLVMRRGKLDQSGYSQIKQHPAYGRKILQAYARAYPWLPQVVYQEHERHDGSGYPEGILGEEIHPYARIIGLADTYEALTHSRPFRERMIPFNVLQQLIRLGGRLYSSDLVKALIQEISVFPLGSFVHLNTGEVGRVVGTNRGYPLRPIVQVLLASDETPLEQERLIDLREEPMLYITGPVDLRGDGEEEDLP